MNSYLNSCKNSYLIKDLPHYTYKDLEEVKAIYNYEFSKLFVLETFRLMLKHLPLDQVGIPLNAERQVPRMLTRLGWGDFNFICGISAQKIEQITRELEIEGKLVRIITNDAKYPKLKQAYWQIGVNND